MGFYYLGNCSAVVDCCKIVSILFLVSYPSDIHVENWLHLDEFHDPELKKLASLLPSIIVSDRAPSTICTYFSSYRLWKRWASTHSLCPIPADGTALALYIVSLIQQQRSVSAVNSAIYGVNWVHKKNGFGLPSEHSVVKQVTEAARRILAKPTTRKIPLTIAQVTGMVTRLEKGSLADLQVAAMIALGFYGFLRWDDLSRITPEHLVFAPTHLAVCLEKRKNDQFREGSQVVISRADKAPCPVAVVEKFLRKGDHDRNRTIWRRIQNTRNGPKLRSAPMTYSRASELFKKAVKDEGLDAKEYGLHSLRSGGATTAAALGIPDRLLQRQGGWRTAKAKNNYILESRSALLHVTKKMQNA